MMMMMMVNVASAIVKLEVRIAAATWRVTSAHARYFLYSTMGWEMSPT